MSGYAGLAQRMSLSVDLGSIRRFTSLNFQRLLYLQAELTILEDEWRAIEQTVDAKTNIEDRYRSHSWSHLKADADWQKFVDLQKKLDEYSKQFPADISILTEQQDEAILRFHAVSKLLRPSKDSLSAINNILEDPLRREYLLASDKDNWKDGKKEDLILATQVEETDKMSFLFAWAFVNIKYKLLGRPKPMGDVVHVEEQSLTSFGKIVSTVLSSLLPVLGIVVLAIIKTMWKRLVILAAFTSLFSLILALMTTNSKRLEMFAAAAT